MHTMEPFLAAFGEALQRVLKEDPQFGERMQTALIRSAKDQVQELAHYLLRKTARFDLVNPKLTFEREDTQALRKKILSLSGAQAKKLGLNKSTLHYLRKQARDRKPFRIYEPVLAKLSI